MRAFQKEVKNFSRILADQVLNSVSIPGSDLTFMLGFGNVDFGKKLFFFQNFEIAINHSTFYLCEVFN